MALFWAGSALVWAVLLTFAIKGHNTRGTVVYALFIALSVVSLIWNLRMSTRPPQSLGQQAAGQPPAGHLDRRTRATLMAFTVGGAAVGVGIVVLGFRAPGKPDVVLIVCGLVTLLGVVVMLVQWSQLTRRSGGGQPDQSDKEGRSL